MIIFKDHEAAERCVQLMDKRYFAQRQLSCTFYDGYTNYKIEETEQEKQNRIKEWEDYIERCNDDD